MRYNDSPSKIPMLKNRKRRTIFFVWNYRNWGGAQIYFLAIMKAAREKWDMLVLLPRGHSEDFLEFLRQLDVPYEFIEGSLDLNPAPSILKKLSRQATRIRSEITIYRHLLKYDLKNSILHIESAPWQSWILLTALAARGANIFVTIHNAVTAPSRGRRAVWKARLAFLSKLRGFHVFAANEDARVRLGDLFPANFLPKIILARAAIDPEQIDCVLEMPFNRAAVRERFEIPETSRVVLCVGQFVDRKGRWIFLDAARRIAADPENITFVWLTPSLPDESERSRIDEFGLRERFKIIASSDVGTSREEILSFMRIADIFVLPSLVEGLPIALLEAMALGIPAISTSIYAIPEAIKDRKTGLLIEPGNSIALAESIRELLTDDDLRESLGRNAMEFVRANFDERESAKICLASYEKCFNDAAE